MAQTCRRGLGVSMARPLWLTAYRRLHASLPLPDNIEEPILESMSSKELESVVVRISRLAHNWNSQHPVSTSRHRFGEKSVTEDGQWIHGLRILPGGRWLLSQSNAGLRLWDLESGAIEASMALIVTQPEGACDSRILPLEWDVDVSGGDRDSYTIAFCWLHPLR
jgi:hypothetical protein